MTDSLKSIVITDSVYLKVEIKAQYPGGEEIRKRFIRYNSNGEIPLKKGCPLGTYTVIVKCIIDIAGNITKITSQTNHGYGMEEEVIRVIKKIPPFIPAIKDDITVKSTLSLPFTFKIFR